MQIINVSSNLNNVNQLAFGSAVKAPKKSKFFKPVKEFMQPGIKKINQCKSDYVHEPLAQVIAKVFSTKPIKWLVEKTKTMDLTSHLMNFTSIVLSGFYIRQTLKNDRLDERKRKTLAINQGFVSALSIIGCYTFDRFTNNLFDKKILTRFAAVNSNLERDVLKKYMFGLNTAKKIMIIGFMHRFFTPVLVTPIANHIGNKLHEKKQEELANAKQPLNKTV